MKDDRWGLILAGGDGTRLLPLTRRIAGDERPKQFCPLLGGKTLLEQTRCRCALALPPEQTLVILTRTHEPFFASLGGDLPPERVVIQPENRGTAPAILYGLLRLAAANPTGTVAVFPSDHYVSDDAAFMAHVLAAFQAARNRPELVILLGMEADSPETEYGWIEPAEPIGQPGSIDVFRVRSFWEKPSVARARMLWARGCLWNSFVMVAGVSALLALIRRAVPPLAYAFRALEPELGTLLEDEAVRGLYARIPSTNFSRQILATRPANLAVLPVRGVAWSDLGRPGRVLSTLARLGVHPAWAEPAAVPA